MKYTVCFEYYGAIEIEADDEFDAADKIYGMPNEYLLEHTNGVFPTSVIDENDNTLVL